MNTKAIPHVVNIIRDGGQEVIDKTSISMQTIMSVYFIGVALISIYYLIMYYRSYRMFAKSLPVNNAYVSDWKDMHKLRRNIDVRTSEWISSPLTYGIVHPVILLPKDFNWDNIDQVDYVFEHEFNHIKSFDVLRKGILLITLTLHWFNPFVWILYILANRDIELACDEQVIFTYGKSKKSEYATTLLDIEEERSLKTLFYSSFSRNSIEERITLIMKAKKNSIIVAAFATVVLFGALVYVSSPMASKVSANVAPKQEEKEEPKSTEEVFKKENMTYEEFEEWSNKKLEESQKLVDSGEISQETYNLEKQDYAEVLEEIKNGARVDVRETADGQFNIMIKHGNDDYDMDVNYSDDGTEVTVTEKAK
jgi:beta-lactamase regulating signal transducer with metallopeptidase domain